MARPRRTNEQLIQRAQETVRHTQDAAQLRQALAVLLPAQTQTTLEQTARLLGVGRATVPRLQARFRQQLANDPPAKPRQWGGRRRALMSEEQAREFLAPWAEQAKKGGVLVLSPMRAALAQRVSHPWDKLHEITLTGKAARTAA
jgi:hypothetical protein